MQGNPTAMALNGSVEEGRRWDILPEPGASADFLACKVCRRSPYRIFRCPLHNSCRSRQHPQRKGLLPTRMKTSLMILGQSPNTGRMAQFHGYSSSKTTASWYGTVSCTAPFTTGRLTPV
jgi:hypothetical protein